MKLTIIIEINRFIIIINFHNCFFKALTEIFQFRRALIGTLQKQQLIVSYILPKKQEFCLDVTHTILDSHSFERKF
jgi:hypothetical protein